MCSSTVSESSSKDAPHEIADIEISEIRTFSSDSSEIEASISTSSEAAESTFSHGVILAFFLFISNHLISFIRFLEFFLISSSVWMMLNGCLFEGLLDLLSRRILRHS